MATDLNEIVFNALTADSAITALVGTRIRPDILDNGETMPAIVYWRVSGIHYNTIDGAFAEIAEARYTIEAYAVTRKAANALAEAVRLRMIDLPTVNTAVRHVSVESGQQHYTNGPIDGTEVSRYVTAQDFRLTFIEDV